MAENVNLLVDQTRTTSSFKSLWETPHEPKPSLIEDQKEELNNPYRAQAEQEQQSVNVLGSLVFCAALFQRVRQQAGEGLRNSTNIQNREAKKNIAETERLELHANRDVADPDRNE